MCCCIVYPLSLAYSKLWTRNKPGDEMTDKYNTSSHYTAGENTELGKTVKLYQINYTLLLF